MAGPKAELAQSTALVRGAHVLSTAEGLDSGRWRRIHQESQELPTLDAESDRQVARGDHQHAENHYFPTEVRCADPALASELPRSTGGSGGGIDTGGLGGLLDLRDSTVSGNRANGNGGGIRNIPRPRDGNLDSVARCDIGAVEL